MIIDEQRMADYLDSMAEDEDELDEDDGWDGIDDISPEERNACDHYNERYVMPCYD